MRISRKPFPVQIIIDKKRVENVEYLKNLGSMTASDARYALKIRSKFAMSKAALNKKHALFISELDLNMRKKLVKCYTWSTALSGVETWTLQKVDEKYL
jgi:hypothetical protein